MNEYRRRRRGRASAKPEIRLTPLMRQKAKQFNEPLPIVIKRLLDENGPKETARILNISQSVLGYWMLKLKLRVARVAVPPGHQVVIIDSRGRERIASTSHGNAAELQP